MGPVRSLFAKIMLAQVAAVVLALLVVLIITRLSLDRGFMDFLERQESGILGHLSPALAEVYAAQGGWDFLREDPSDWHRILRRSRPHDPSSHAADRIRPPRGEKPAGGEERFRWLRTFDRLELRERLFLLDHSRHPIAGAPAPHQGPHEDHARLEPVIVDGQTVGWIGFSPLKTKRPAEVQRFLHGQVRAHAIALIVALLMVSILAYALARHLSRPVAQLDQTVNELSRGRFERRASVRSRDEIGRLAENVNRLADTLEKNRDARHRWINDIAHELRTPVAILKGEIEAVGDGLRLADKKTIASLGEEVDHLSRLVDDLQSMALADAGALSLERHPLDLGAAVHQAGAAFQSQFERRAINLEIHASEPVTVNADAHRIRQLLNNLLENCTRYVDEGGSVRLTVSAGESGGEILVDDSGPGVAEDALERLFERFYRIEAGRSRAGGGSGLGLSICRSIVEAHGGTIEAQRSPMGGLRIRAQLPY
jgi:two-component system sensor histidine kinase BaeS